MTEVRLITKKKNIPVYNGSDFSFQEGCLHKMDSEDKSYLKKKIGFEPDLIISYNPFWMVTSGFFKDEVILERDFSVEKFIEYIEKAEKPIVIVPFKESVEQINQYKPIKESNLVFSLLGVE